MTVVAYPHIRPQGPGPWVEVEKRDITSAFRSPLSNATRTVERPGAAWAFRVHYENLTRANADRLMAFLSSCRGMAQRFYLPIWSHTRRGSGFGSELLTNGTFADGTTGWTGNKGSLSCPDMALRIAITEVSASGFPSAFQPKGLTAYAPHSIRGVLHDGRGMSGVFAGVYMEDGVVSASVSSAVRGLVAASVVPVAATASSQSPIIIWDQSGYLAGDYLECSFASLARCALVDNGPNLLLRSDEFDNASWTKAADNTVTANVTGPDGSATADVITESNTNNAEHYVLQAVTVPSAVADFSFSCAIGAINRSWAAIRMIENTGSQQVYAFVNLATGAVGTVTSSGANWTNARAHVASLGGGYYKCTITARKTNAATSVSCAINSATADASFTYAGTAATNAIAMWRATSAQSSVPTRLRQTTTTLTAGTSQTGGALHLKGLPASTNGLLLAGDWVQLPGIEQAVRARTALNSDAAGLGYFEFEPFLRESPADNSPVIVTNPLVRCLLDENTISETETAEDKVNIQFLAVEDVAPT